MNRPDQLTTEELAQAYGVSSNTLLKNFRRHKSTFVENKHYLLLEGDTLKEFLATANFDEDKMSLSKFDEDKMSLSKSQGGARKLYLWTKKGAFKHAQFLNSSRAWEVYEGMIEAAGQPQTTSNFPPEAFKALQEKYRAALELAATHMEIKEFKVPFDEEDMEDGVMIIARLTDYYQQLMRKEKNPAPIHQAILRELKQTNKNWTQTRDYLEEHYDEVNRAYIEQASLKHLVSSSAGIAALTTPITTLPQIESPHKAN